MDKLLLAPPPAEALRPDSKADPELLNRYLQLQIQMLEKNLRDGVEQSRKQVARRLVLEKITPAAFWVLLLAVVAIVVSAQDWGPLSQSLGRHSTLSILSQKMQGLGTFAGQALSYKDVLIPVFLFVSALALRVTTTRIQGTAIVIGLSSLMMLTLYALTANADLEWSWRQSALFFVPGVLIAAGLIHRLGTIELQLYRGTGDQWSWYRSLPRRYPSMARAWRVTCWAGRVARLALRMTRRRLIIFLAAPFVATVLLVSLTVVPGGLRAWVSIAFFSIWVVWGYLAVLARPGMLPPAPHSRKRWVFTLVPAVSLLALVAASATYENELSAVIATLAGLVFLVWSPWGLAVAVRSDHFFQPFRRLPTMLVFAILPGLCALLLIVAWLWTDGFSHGISYAALQGVGAVLVLSALCLYPLWLFWAFAVLPTGLRQTYVSLYIWLLVAALYGPGLFMSVMLGLLAISIPFSIWQSRHLYEGASGRSSA